jgi:hypothetical protein
MSGQTSTITPTTTAPPANMDTRSSSFMEFPSASLSFLLGPFIRRGSRSSGTGYSDRYFFLGIGAALLVVLLFAALRAWF